MGFKPGSLQSPKGELGVRECHRWSTFPSMAVWNLRKRKKLTLLLKPLVQLEGLKGILTGSTDTDPHFYYANFCGLRIAEVHGPGQGNSSSVAIHRGRFKQSPDILQVMDWPDSWTYASLLQECIDKKTLPEGKLVHAHMIGKGFDPGIFLGTKLVIVYAKCGSLMDARRILDEMPERNVICWTVMIAAYARQGYDEEALTLFWQMQRQGIRPDKFTFAGILPACANLAALKHGEEIHFGIITSGLLPDVFVGSALVDMYAKCGSITSARQVFDEMSERDVVSWNAVIAGYAQNGYADEAMKLFQKLPEQSVITWNTIIAGYTQIGNVDEAMKLFRKMPKRDVVSWNVMIGGCTQNGHSSEALKLFGQLLLTGLQPDSVTFTGVLAACTNLEDMKHGKEVHGDIIRSGFQIHVSVGSALVDMYAKCRNMEYARQVFDGMPERNVVSWNAMIAAYTRNGDTVEALKLFQKMPVQDVVSWNEMIAGYAKNGRVDEAMKLFQNMSERDVVSWNVMIAGYVQNGHFDEALELFGQMQMTEVKPDAVTFTGILPASANLAALKNGKEVHGNVIRRGFQYHISVGSALIDMYAKCGAIDQAHNMFNKMLERDIVSWNAMIVGYAKNGCGREALQLFEQMQHSGINPDYVTFIGVLSACSHSGLVDRGWHYFDCMRRDYRITPAVEHYCCIVDLLGRAGLLDEAQDLVKKMPIKPNAAVWGSLLGACRIHTNIELGEYVAERLLELDPENAACYVLLSNIYAAAGKWDDVEKVRKLMKDRGIKKIPGCSWIESDEGQGYKQDSRLQLDCNR